jgi:AcrR family transcriptional regulator
MLNVRSQSDRTAKATIRDEAMRLFAARGADAVTVREIAAAASVSPALVMQHYGSKDGLLAAVDDHVIDEFTALLDAIVVRSPGGAGEQPLSGSLIEIAVDALGAESPLPAYLTRMLTGTSEAGRLLFERLYELAQGTLDALVEQGAAAGGDRRVRAAVLLTNDLAVMMLRHRIADAIGIDPLSRAGLAAWSREVDDIYHNGLGGSH